MSMRFDQRAYAKVLFNAKLAELTENAFEDFFHRMMSACHPDYINIRTHGNIGDRSADGMGLYDRKLYASYAPAVYDVNEIKRKFISDVKGALEKRDGEFDIFVFVHNDARGAHPDIPTLLADASREHSPIKFEHMGRLHLWNECLKLELGQVEDLLGAEIPIEETVYGIGLADLAPLLDRLKEQAVSADPFAPVPRVNEEKLDFNRLEGDTKYELVKAMKSTLLVEEYYQMRITITERDEAARGFSIYYESVKEYLTDPEEIMLELEMYILGNRRQSLKMHRAAWVVLAYFFERCDIFEQPPDGWSVSSDTLGSSS